MTSVLIVNTRTDKCVFYMRNRLDGLHYGRINIDLKQQGWENAGQFIRERCAERTEVQYMKQMNKELNDLIIGGAKYIAERNKLEQEGKDEVSLRRLEKSIDEACIQAVYYGMSPTIARAKMEFIASGKNVVPFRHEKTIPFSVLQVKTGSV